MVTCRIFIHSESTVISMCCLSIYCKSVLIMPEQHNTITEVTEFLCYVEPKQVNVSNISPRQYFSLKWSPSCDAPTSGHFRASTIWFQVGRPYCSQSLMYSLKQRVGSEYLLLRTSLRRSCLPSWFARLSHFVLTLLSSLTIIFRSASESCNRPKVKV